MLDHGFVRVAAAAPRLRVADVGYNVERIKGIIGGAASEGVQVLLFPELCITGYTCGDLFQQQELLYAAGRALRDLARATEDHSPALVVVGLPLAVEGQLYNCAAVLNRGRVLGLVPKSFIPNYKEFYERRWFMPAAGLAERTVDGAAFGTSLLFEAPGVKHLSMGVEICEDLWVPSPPSSAQAIAGATLLLNLSASNDLIGKAAYRRQLVVNQSARCIAAYAYASCGVHESTTDVVFGGHCLIAEDGTLLTETKRFVRDDDWAVADVDLDRLVADRLRMSSLGDAQKLAVTQFPWRRIGFLLEGKPSKLPLRRTIEAHPFVPQGQEQLRERCEEIFHIQVAGLAKRLEYVGKPKVTIGVSGGLDSTLSLLVACRTMDVLEVPRSQVLGFSMPGFGTTQRTRQNAATLMRQLGITAHVHDVRSLCLEEMKLLGHKPFGIDLAGLTVEQFTEHLQRLPADRRKDLTFENVQARMRMNLLMNSGFVIGTSDLSELALGWTTYCGDHASMYNPNCSIPKTLVKFLIRWVAENEFEGEARQTLLDIAASEISPELLPTDAQGKSWQSTEAVVGPYELHDFFLFYFLRYGYGPWKILYLAEQAKFDRAYSKEELRRWLRVFLERFFANQFKRSFLPDGPKVGSVSLSPRGDWRMPSDAEAKAWLDSLPRD